MYLNGTAAGGGSVYSTGYFIGTADFNPGSGTFYLTASSSDMYISKLDSAGNFVWASGMGGTGFTSGLGIIASTDGYIYTTGYFYDTTDFDPGTGTFNLTSTGNSDIFISKLNSAGNFVWACHMGGTSYDDVAEIAIAPDGSVYLTGDLEGTADFNPGQGVFNLSSTGDNDIFVAKLLPFHAPTDIALTANSVAENKPGGTVIGSFSSSDQDTGDAFTYTLVSGTGSTDNASFTINTGQLRTASIFNYEAKSSYNIRVRTTDYSGMWYEESMTIAITDVNAAPTNITLFSSTIAENQPSGTVVNTFTTLDIEQPAGPFTYSLVSGSGSTDNASFAIVGTSLQTAAIFDYETKSSYTIRVRSTDQGGMWFEKVFAISITDVAENDTHTWDGGSTVNNLWTTKENWLGDVAPVPGDNLVFPAGAGRMENLNDFALGTVFGSVTIYCSGYNIQGNANKSSNVVVQPTAKVEFKTISSGTLTIGAGGVVTISPIINTYTWDGGGANNLWMTKENWVGDVAPMIGGKLVFPAGAAKADNINNYPAGMKFDSIVIADSNYHFQGDLTGHKVEVQTNAKTEIKKIVADTLTIGAGAVVTISPIAGGPLSGILHPITAIAAPSATVSKVSTSMAAESMATVSMENMSKIVLKPINSKIKDSVFGQAEMNARTEEKMPLSVKSANLISTPSESAVKLLFAGVDKTWIIPSKLEDELARNQIMSQAVYSIVSTRESLLRCASNDIFGGDWQWNDNLDNMKKETKRRYR